MLIVVDVGKPTTDRRSGTSVREQQSCESPSKNLGVRPSS